MSHTIHYSLITFLAIALLVSVLIEKSHQPERGDTIESLLMTLPNDSESDHRKHATLVAACSSIADLIRSDSMKDTDEVIAAFHIETAN